MPGRALPGNGRGRRPGRRPPPVRAPRSGTDMASGAETAGRSRAHRFPRRAGKRDAWTGLTRARRGSALDDGASPGHVGSARPAETCMRTVATATAGRSRGALPRAVHTGSIAPVRSITAREGRAGAPQANPRPARTRRTPGVERSASPAAGPTAPAPALPSAGAADTPFVPSCPDIDPEKAEVRGTRRSRGVRSDSVGTGARTGPDVTSTRCRIVHREWAKGRDLEVATEHRAVRPRGRHAPLPKDAHAPRPDRPARRRALAAAPHGPRLGRRRAHGARAAGARGHHVRLDTERTVHLYGKRHPTGLAPLSANAAFRFHGTRPSEPSGLTAIARHGRRARGSRSRYPSGRVRVSKTSTMACRSPSQTRRTTACSSTGSLTARGRNSTTHWPLACRALS